MFTKIIAEYSTSDLADNGSYRNDATAAVVEAFYSMKKLDL